MKITLDDSELSNSYTLMLFVIDPPQEEEEPEPESEPAQEAVEICKIDIEAPSV